MILFATCKPSSPFAPAKVAEHGATFAGAKGDKSETASRLVGGVESRLLPKFDRVDVHQSTTGLRILEHKVQIILSVLSLQR